MRLCLLSTFPPQRCGIATYTAALAQALNETGELSPWILSEWNDGSPVGTVESAGIQSHPTFVRTTDYGPAVLARARELEADIVHVQHSPDIFGMDGRLTNLLAALKQNGIASVVTLHTVHSALSAAIERRFAVAKFHQSIADSVGRIIVHGGDGMSDVLVCQGVDAERITEIPHGTSAIATLDKAEARRRLELPPDAQVLLCFGFIHLQKNLHTVILAMDHLVERQPNVVLYLTGSLQNRAWFNRGYLALLHLLKDRPKLRNKVVLKEQFVPAEETACLYGAADVVLLPYAQGYGSASGIAHNAIGARRIPLCSRSPKFREVGAAIDEGLLVPTHSPKAWADALFRLLTDGTWQSTLLQKVDHYAQITAWPAVAQQHLALYRSLVNRP